MHFDYLTGPESDLTAGRHIPLAHEWLLRCQSHIAKMPNRFVSQVKKPFNAPRGTVQNSCAATYAAVRGRTPIKTSIIAHSCFRAFSTFGHLLDQTHPFCF